MKNLVKDTPSSSAACIPLLQHFPSSLEDTVSATVTSPSSIRPFGSLCISFQHDIIPKETVAAAHSLSRALAYGHRKALLDHAQTIISCLGASMHPIPEDDLDSEDGDFDNREESTDLNEEDFNHEASCSKPTTLDYPRDYPPMTPLSSTSSSTSPSQSFWMTFKDPTLEKGYLKWYARHMRPFDPAATVLTCIMFCAIGFSRSPSMARNHPLVWATGWIALLPMLLCLFPTTNNVYMAHRELCLMIFHISGLGWHVSTANTTKYLGDAIFLLYRNPKICFAWQPANLVMFQLRWKAAVALSVMMFVVNSIPLTAGLCSLFKHHSTNTATSSSTTHGLLSVAFAESRCEKMTLLYGAAQLFATLVVLRLNESRTRKLFLNNWETKRRQQMSSSSSSSLRPSIGSTKEKVV